MRTLRLPGLAVFTLCLLAVSSCVPTKAASTSPSKQRKGRAAATNVTTLILVSVQNPTVELDATHLKTGSSTKYISYNEQNTESSALPDETKEERVGSPSLENDSGGSESGNRLTKYLDCGENCEAECVEEQPIRPGLPTFQCPNAASFYRLVSQLEDQQVAVRVSQVNGGLALPPTASLRLVALYLQQTNTTHFSNHSQVLTSLEELYLDGNPDFDASSLLQLGQLPSLAVLQLAGSAQATLNGNLWQLLKGLPALQHLDVSATSLHHLPLDTFWQNPKLKSLNIGGNEFINITFDQGIMQQLTYLNISGSRLKNLEVEIKSAEAAQTNHLSVDLSHNYLTSLPTSFMNFVAKNLVHIIITDNLWNESCKLCSLYHLWNYEAEHSDLVDGAQSLRCFLPEEALKFCGWEECPAHCMCDAETKTVDCRNADLITVPHLAPSDAEILLLENNSLFDMSGIESPAWCSVRIVNADNNRITSVIPPDSVGQCTCFDHDDFSGEGQNCFPQALQKLSLSNNKIKNLSHSDCHLLYSLKELHLSGNEVEHLGSHVCSSFELLEVLYLDNNSYNDLEEQDVAPYPNLRELHLSFNSLTTLPYRIIELMPKLKILDVSNNQLRQFSGETRTPDTPFTSLVSISLEELDLSNNNLELINPVLDLKHIPTLKNLSIHNNPWECSCETIKDLAARVFEDLKHMAMVKAVQTLRCHKPASLRDVVINDPKALQICKEAEGKTSIFSAVVGIMIILALIGVVAYITCQKAPTFVRNALRSSSFYDGTFKRRYSVVLVHAWEDSEMVKTDLVDPLRDLGYFVGWNENVFPPCENTDASIERAVINSKRMLVVASRNLMNYDHGEQMIQRGLSEEDREPGFKVLALVLDNLPKELPYRALYNIVVKRTPVFRSSSNYISKICDFLPDPVSSHPSVCLTETDVNSFWFKQVQRIERREYNRTKWQRACLQEIFPYKKSDGCGNSVGTTNSVPGNEAVAEGEGFSRAQPDGHCTRF